MRDFRETVREIQETVRIMRGDDAVPFRMVFGTTAYVRLRDIMERGADPGLPNTWGAAPRSLLLLYGLPIDVDDRLPGNMWFVLDRNGDAIQAGILNQLKEEPDGRTA